MDMFVVRLALNASTLKAKMVVDANEQKPPMLKSRLSPAGQTLLSTIAGGA
jgi:hypothetical protein